MKKLIMFLLATFNTISVNSSNLDCPSFGYYHIEVYNVMHQRIELDISIDDKSWRMKLFSLGTVTYDNEFDNPDELVDYLRQYSESKEFTRAK